MQISVGTTKTIKIEKKLPFGITTNRSLYSVNK
jgi:hypothetical protein